MKPTKKEREFWKRCRERRIELGWTQEKLAKRAKVLRTTIVNIENGTHRTMLEHALLIGEILGVQWKFCTKKYVKIPRYK